MKDVKIVLASASPRRRMLLEQIGMEFEVCPSNKEEIVTGTNPKDVCVELSKQKAEDVASSIIKYNEEHTDITTPQDIIVIGADTIVSYNDKILGKPKNELDAKNMLKLLSGNVHTVYTGITIVVIYKNGRTGEYSFHESTDVEFYELKDSEIDEYISSGEPLDKAGAYGIQGAFAKHIKRIDGDFYNVVGLPLARLYHELNL